MSIRPWQVERVFGAAHPDPVEIERAKKVLKVSTTFYTIWSHLWSLLSDVLNVFVSGETGAWTSTQRSHCKACRFIRRWKWYAALYSISLPHTHTNQGNLSHCVLFHIKSWLTLYSLFRDSLWQKGVVDSYMGKHWTENNETAIYFVSMAGMKGRVDSGVLYYGIFSWHSGTFWCSCSVI